MIRTALFTAALMVPWLLSAVAGAPDGFGLDCPGYYEVDDDDDVTSDDDTVDDDSTEDDDDTIDEED